jgi:hypothetical protein
MKDLLRGRPISSNIEPVYKSWLCHDKESSEDVSTLRHRTDRHDKWYICAQITLSVTPVVSIFDIKLEVTRNDGTIRLLQYTYIILAFWVF